MKFYEKLDSGEIRLRFIRDKEIGEWITDSFIGDLVYGLASHRVCVVNHDVIWPWVTGSVLELIKNNPCYSKSQKEAVERILTDGKMKDICNELRKKGGEEALAKFLSGVFGLFAQGVLRKPTDKSDVQHFLYLLVMD